MSFQRAFAAALIFVFATGLVNAETRLGEIQKSIDKQLPELMETFRVPGYVGGVWPRVSISNSRPVSATLRPATP